MSHNHDVRVSIPSVKLSAIKVVYENGVLVVDDYKCSRCETLAIANLLIPDYGSIVKEARTEQRKKELRHAVGQHHDVSVLDDDGASF